MLRALIPFLVATVIAAALGAGATRLPFMRLEAAAVDVAAAKPADAAADKGHADKARADQGHGEKGHADKGHGDKKDADKSAAASRVAGVVALPPVVAPLKAPAEVWVRFEGAIVVDAMPAPEAALLASRVAADTLAYFSTQSLPDLEGGAGLNGVREDLLERARLRSDGKVRELLVTTLVAQ
jgi:flagellar FliL protein